MRRGGVLPEFLEVVVGADRRLHDVDHDVAAVDQYPFARLLALDADDRRAGLLQLVADMGARAFTCRFDSALAMMIES